MAALRVGERVHKTVCVSVWREVGREGVREDGLPRIVRPELHTRSIVRVREKVLKECVGERE